MIYREKVNAFLFLNCHSQNQIKSTKLLFNCNKTTINRRIWWSNKKKKILNAYSINTFIKMSRMDTKKIRRGND